MQRHVRKLFPQKDWSGSTLALPTSDTLSNTIELYDAARAGDLSRVKNALAQGAKPNLPYRTLTPLMAAAENGHKKIVKFLISKGAEVNLYTSGRETALMLAAMHGHMGVAKLLIKNGADLNAFNCEGHTALLYAIHYGHKKLAFLIISEGLKGFDKNKINGADFLRSE